VKNLGYCMPVRRTLARRDEKRQTGTTETSARGVTPVVSKGWYCLTNHLQKGKKKGGGKRKLRFLCRKITQKKTGGGGKKRKNKSLSLKT